MLAFCRSKKVASQCVGKPLLLERMFTSSTVFTTSLRRVWTIPTLLRSFRLSRTDYSPFTRYHAADLLGFDFMQCCLHMYCDWFWFHRLDMFNSQTMPLLRTIFSPCDEQPELDNRISCNRLAILWGMQRWRTCISTGVVFRSFHAHCRYSREIRQQSDQRHANLNNSCQRFCSSFKCTLCSESGFGSGSDDRTGWYQLHAVWDFIRTGQLYMTDFLFKNLSHQIYGSRRPW